MEKFRAEAALSTFRSGLQYEKIRIVGPGCPQLCYQLEHGIWNRNQTDYERSTTMGHWDLGKAAVYMYRMSKFRENPDIPLRLPIAKYFNVTRVQNNGNAIARILNKKF